ncbi:MAG: tetratricopeptide repeat protein [Methylotenera sp.]|nr:tetratricopeptide repeat protein [Oligoflexia bacterium]
MSVPQADKEIQDLLGNKKFAQAEVLIRDKLTREPDSADGFYMLGVLHYFQGQVGPTVENLKKALSIDPRHTDAAICLSVLLNDIGKYEDAKKVFEQANHSVVHKKDGIVSGVDQKFAVKHLELGDLYFRYRRYDEAIEEYGKAALLDPTTLDIRIRRAKAYAKKGFLTRAMQELQSLKHEHDNFTPARIQLGLLHYSQGNVLDAELEWEGVLQTDPVNREAHAYLEMAKQARLKPRR